VLKQELTYENYDGLEVTETFYFNLSKPELLEMEVSGAGGSFSDSMERIVKSKNAQQIIMEFKKLILASYGEKSSDGKRFVKTDQLREEFTQSAAYEALFMKLATDEEFALSFCKGIVPKELSEAMDKAEQETVMVQGKEVPKPPR
jgi:hypothetical protein